MSASAPSEPETIYCGTCGYDLRGLTSDRCPECGLTIDATRGEIPRQRRAEIGYVRSSLPTVEMATFRPFRLAMACTSPVNFRGLIWLMIDSLQ
jgi:hypothetical protein